MPSESEILSKHDPMFPILLFPFVNCPLLLYFIAAILKALSLHRVILKTQGNVISSTTYGEQGWDHKKYFLYALNKYKDVITRPISLCLEPSGPEHICENNRYLCTCSSLPLKNPCDDFTVFL